MLTIEFPGFPKVQAIIVDEPVNGVSGIVECDACDWRKVLKASETEAMANEIEEFIKSHKCVLLAKQEEVVAFAERLKENMPGFRVRLIKGRKVIREF